MATYLDRILAAHRLTAAGDERPVAALLAAAEAAPPARGFAAALAAETRLAVIAEVKRRSPSKGELAPGLDPAALGASYAAGGAACLSALTDAEFFGGSPADLAAARAGSGLPVLRKDFTVCERDVLDARVMGADCVLLIAAALDDAELAAFHALAAEVGLDALVEIHDEAELERALAVGATLVGVNQRDLVTFEVDTARAERMAPLMPPEVVRVAESGIGGPADAARLAAAGYHAVLVGESLVRAADPAAAVAALRLPVPGPSQYSHSQHSHSRDSRERGARA
ncbi:MAG: indole-3-glycerol phosphate synthase TrpC [Acidimicrobiales bacterium]